MGYVIASPYSRITPPNIQNSLILSHTLTHSPYKLTIKDSFRTRRPDFATTHSSSDVRSTKHIPKIIFKWKPKTHLKNPPNPPLQTILSFFLNNFIVLWNDIYIFFLSCEPSLFLFVILQRSLYSYFPSGSLHALLWQTKPSPNLKASSSLYLFLTFHGPSIPVINVYVSL